MILVNLFVGIICDALAAAQEDSVEDGTPDFFPILSGAIGNIKNNRGKSFVLRN